jgi:hypothetical protein
MVLEGSSLQGTRSGDTGWAQAPGWNTVMFEILLFLRGRLSDVQLADGGQLFGVAGDGPVNVMKAMMINQIFKLPSCSLCYMLIRSIVYGDDEGYKSSRTRSDATACAASRHDDIVRLRLSETTPPSIIDERLLHPSRLSLHSNTSTSCCSFRSHSLYLFV